MFNADPYQTEKMTHELKDKQQVFLNYLTSTPVMKSLYDQLREKGFPETLTPKIWKQFLNVKWFDTFGRGFLGSDLWRAIGSSGFEFHFICDYVSFDKEVLGGFNNWMHYYHQQIRGNVNYLGYSPVEEPSRLIKQVGSIAAIGFSWTPHGTNQTAFNCVKTMFIGATPELEIALITLCFIARRDKICHLKLNDQDVGLYVHDQKSTTTETKGRLNGACFMPCYN